MKGLFPNNDFSWSMRMRREPVEKFFAPQIPGLLDEKKHLLATRPDLYLATSPSADLMAAECREMAIKWGHVSENLPSGLASLGGEWEADLIFLEKDTDILSGGCVCFPSSWSLAESVGVSLLEIHDRVPGLNEAIGEKIRKFLAKMSPEQAFFRENWSITRTADLNYHPEMKRARIDPTMDENSAFLRIEHQCFVQLQHGILLAVRIEPVAFPELVESFPDTADQLLRQLKTMPPEVAEYKSLTAGLGRAIEILDSLIVH